MSAIRVLTLNAHSLLEENWDRKATEFVEFLLQERADVIALQEVNQTADAAEVMDIPAGMVPVCGAEIPLRCDNYALRLAEALREAGVECSWAWLPVKLGYEKYDEGLAVFALGSEIEEAFAIPVSNGRDYRSWRTRSALCVKLRGGDDRFCTVHMGWWDDAEEPFLQQWENLQTGLPTDGRVWLMGDFNAPAEVRGEGYDRIRADGWHDLWLSAEEKRGEATVRGRIDGWRDRLENPEQGVRIDHIFCSRPVPVRSARVVLDGKNEPQVSDHFGVLLETKGEIS